LQPSCFFPRYLDKRCAKGVGMVQSNYVYYHSPLVGEKRLVRYQLAN